MSLFAAAKGGIMTVWYRYVRLLTTAFPYTTIEGKRFFVFPGVYKPLENEHSCADYCKSGDRILDLGCGSGVGAIFCADKAEYIVASDISETALQNSRENCTLHGVNNISFVHSDMFDNIEGEFDLILANPPYVAADFDNDEDQYATSTRYLPKMFRDFDKHLASGGRLLVQYPAWFRGGLIKRATEQGLRLVEEKRMPAKSPMLALLSLAYLQVGFRSTFFLFERASEAKSVPAPEQQRAAA